MSAPPLVDLQRVFVDGRLADTTLSFHAGTLVAVIGENGAGKSTLLDVAAGVCAPSRGEVRLTTAQASVVVAAMPVDARARAIASLGAREPDTDELFVAERIAHGLAPRAGIGWPPDQADARVLAIARELDLTALLSRRLATLSSGERRRVHVARALVDDQAFAYLLDEPLAGIDVARQPLVLAALKARARRGALVMFSVHELGCALGADRLLGVRAGLVVHDGDAASLDADALERVFGVRTLEVIRLGAD